MADYKLINRYLLELEEALQRQFAWDAERLARILSEAEDHLRTTAEDLARASPVDAERRAIERFGLPKHVARRFGRELGAPLNSTELAIRSSLHLGAFVSSIVVAVGIAGVVLSLAGAILGMYGVLGWSHEFRLLYSPEECIGWTSIDSAEHGITSPSECAFFQSAQRDEFARDLQVWLAAGGTLAVLIGGVLSLGFRTLLRRHVAGDDTSIAGRLHVLGGLAFFGLLFTGLGIWFALLVAHAYTTTALSYWMGSALVVSTLFLVAYARAAYRALA